MPTYDEMIDYCIANGMPHPYTVKQQRAVAALMNDDVTLLDLMQDDFAHRHGYRSIDEMIDANTEGR